MTSNDLQVVFTIQQHLLRRNFLSQQEENLLKRIQKQIKACLREMPNSHGKKVKE
jgi:hypothetical protein